MTCNDETIINSTNDIIINSGYDGPHPTGGNICLANGDLDKEDAMFQPGQLPMDFVRVSNEQSCTLDE